jgi:autotransporter-associated beta strand protein
MNRARIALAFVFALAVVSTLGSVSAQNTRYWDADGATAGGSGGTTANGTWGASAFWSADPAGAAATAVWVNGDIAVFSAGNDVTGSSSIDVASDPVAGGVTVEEGTIILTGSGLVTNAGPIRINSGAALQDSSTLSLVTTAGSIMTLDGGTFRNTVAGAGSTFLDADTRTELTSLGGTFDVPTAGNVAYANAIALSAGTTAATFTKTGVGDFRTQVSTNAFTKLVVNGGMYRPGNAVAANLDENTLTTGAFGAAPSSFLADAITLNNGAAIGNVNNITLHNNRGITLGAGGGKISVDGGSMTIPGAISGSAALTIGRFGTTGSAVITLSSTSNSWGGATNITDGTLRLGAAGVIPDPSNVNVTGAGILNLNGNNETVGTVMINSSSAQITGAGVLTGSSYDVRATNTTSAQGISSNLGGSGSLTKTTAGTALLTAVNSYTGSTTISQGVLSVDGDATLGDGTGTLNLSGGTLNTTASRTTTANPISNPINITANSAITTTSAASTPQLNLSSSSVGGTAGTLTFRNDGADAATDVFQPRFSGSGFDFTRPIVIDNGTTGKTELHSFNATGTTQTFSGDISGNGAYVRNESSPGAGGVTVFNGNNTYTGVTTVNGGTLLVHGSLAGTSSVAVNGGGTLGGSGTIVGPVTINSGGTLSPGASIESLNVGALTFNAGSNLNFEFDPGEAPSVGADLLNSSGGLTIAAGAMLSFSDLSDPPVALPPGTRFTLIRYDATANWNGVAFDSYADDSMFLLAGNTFQINYNDVSGGVNFGGGDAGGRYLTVTSIAAVPEASSFLALGLFGAAAATVAVIRKRRLA